MGCQKRPGSVSPSHQSGCNIKAHAIGFSISDDDLSGGADLRPESGLELSVEEIAGNGPNPVLHFVYFEPRIAGNTGAAIRLAAVTGAQLHLVEPLGFNFDEAKVRRAGLDYHDLATLRIHPDIAACFAALPGRRIYAFEVNGRRRHTDIRYRPGDVLLFGPEPSGLPADVLQHPRITERVIIPMLPGRRSLNLTNAAAIAVYEAWRQLDFIGAANPTGERSRRRFLDKLANRLKILPVRG